METNETITDCAIRETNEETRYIKIGEYYRPQFNDIQHIFLGKVISHS